MLNVLWHLKLRTVKLIMKQIRYAIFKECSLSRSLIFLCPALFSEH